MSELIVVNKLVFVISAPIVNRNFRGIAGTLSPEGHRHFTMLLKESYIEDVLSLGVKLSDTPMGAGLCVKVPLNYRDVSSYDSDPFQLADVIFRAAPWRYKDMHGVSALLTSFVPNRDY